MNQISTFITEDILTKASLIWIGIALLLFPVLLKITQPYGRHSKSNWGPMINNKLGWFLMETPALSVFVIIILNYGNFQNLVIVIASGLWILHYFHRVVIYPLRIKTKNKKMPLAITIFGVFFNLINGFLNGYYLALYTPKEHNSNLQIILGIILFLCGYIINKYHDRILINLRKSTEKGYKIPFGGLFKYISCPNFLGEIITWFGFFLVANNLAALSFFIWAIVNLVPRAIDHHKWYRKEFKDYPRNRKAIIPGIL